MFVMCIFKIMTVGIFVVVTVNMKFVAMAVFVSMNV
jgi:hypothetical protein